MTRRPILSLLVGCGLLSLICFAVIAALPRDGYPLRWQQVVIGVLLVCNFATIPPAILTARAHSGPSGVTAAMIATVWRLLTFIAALVLWTATKWPPGEFAAKCLVGCYFPFLILESWLSIRKTSV